MSVQSQAVEAKLHRVTDRDGDVVARVFQGESRFFAVLCFGQVVKGPYDSEADAEEDCLAWIQACERLSMWDSMIDT